jgi:hypothetical protein
LGESDDSSKDKLLLISVLMVMNIFYEIKTHLMVYSSVDQDLASQERGYDVDWNPNL